MIYDKTRNAKHYTNGFEQLSRAMAFIRKMAHSAKDGRYDICGDDMYAIVCSYQTSPDGELPFEAHRKYIDVQCMLKGEERLDVVQGTDFRVKARYSSKKDALFIYPPNRYSSIVLAPGHFALFYPHDFHRPGQSITSPAKVRKLVIKISANYLRKRWDENG